MIIDASALVALVRVEPDADRFARALSETRELKRMSVANWLEAAIVIDGSKSPIASRRFDEAVAEAPASLLSQSLGNRPTSPAPPIATSAKAAAILPS
jgi:ribonuclease VapC